MLQTKAEAQLSTLESFITDYRYDGLGQVTQQSIPRRVAEDSATVGSYRVPDSQVAWTTTQYDALGRILTVLAADGGRTDHYYGVVNDPQDSDFGLTTHDVLDGNRHRTQERYDPLGRRRTVLEYRGDCGALGWGCGGSAITPWQLPETTRYSYTPLDLLTRVVDTQGTISDLNYDSLGRKISHSDPDMGSWSYGYDANGNLTSQTDARGVSLGFSYDQLDRQTGVSGVGVATIYRYDEAGSTYGIGRRTSVENSTARRTFEYDYRGRLRLSVHTVAGLTRGFQWGYDAADRQTSLIYPNGMSAATYYDEAGRPSAICVSGLTSCVVSAATWTASGQPERWTFGNGQVQEWSYSAPVPRLARLTLGTSFERSYGYDWANNIDRITDEVQGQVQRFSYDERNRLVRAWTEGGSNGYDQSVSYDGAGNITSKGGVSYRYGWQSASCPNGEIWKSHAVMAVGTTSYCYDANGNMVRRGVEQLSWNALGQLTRVNGIGLLEDYGYDGDGARVSAIANGQTTIYLEGGLWEEVVGGAQRSYVQFAGQLVAVRDHSSGNVTYLHGDHLGSVSVATNAQGGMVSQQEFDPWGKLRSGGVSQTSRNYTGQILDGTGLLYYTARYYDPSIGRFISADTIVPGNAPIPGS